MLHNQSHASLLTDCKFKYTEDITLGLSKKKFDWSAWGVLRKSEAMSQWGEKI